MRFFLSSLLLLILLKLWHLLCYVLFFSSNGLRSIRFYANKSINPFRRWDKIVVDIEYCFRFLFDLVWRYRHNDKLCDKIMWLCFVECAESFILLFCHVTDDALDTTTGRVRAGGEIKLYSAFALRLWPSDFTFQTLPSIFSTVVIYFSLTVTYRVCARPLSQMIIN